MQRGKTSPHSSRKDTPTRLRLLSTASGKDTLVSPTEAARGTVATATIRSQERVQERRRAVALSRHYRDEEGLSIAEIARGSVAPTPRSRRTSTTRPARKPEPSRAATRGCAEDAGPLPPPGAARATRTNTANAATQARSRHDERAPGCEMRCAHGERPTAVRRHQRTGRERTREDVAAKHCDGCKKATGLRHPRSSICTARGPAREQTPSLRTDATREGAFAVLAGTYQARCQSSSLNATPRVTARSPIQTDGMSSPSRTPRSCSSASAASAPTFRVCAS